MPQDEVQAVLNVIYQSITKSPDSKFLFKPDITTEEAKYFLLGIKNGLFTIDANGYVQSTLLPEKQKKNDQQRMLCLFWRHGKNWSLFREGICQLAEASKLVYKYGWEKTEILMEPKDGEFKDIAYEIDLVASAKNNKKFCIEVKKDDKEFTKLEKGFEYCCSIGLHKKDVCKFPQNHAKFEFCLKVKPDYFAIVSPNIQSAYKMTYSDSYLAFEKVSYDPKPQTLFS